MYKITTIPGDGIGLEVMKPTVEILKTLGDFEFIEKPAGAECYKKYGTNLPEDTINSAIDSDSVLFGAVTSISEQKSAIVTLRRLLDLYANQRPIKSYTDESIDFTIIRENSEGLYSHMEEQIDDDTVIATRNITYKGCERIIRYAFDYAKKTGRNKVTAAHKANILPVTDGIFKDTFYKIADKYPEIEAEDYYIDAMAMHIITQPQNFDVIVTTNLFGDILSDEAGGLLGSLGFIPSANIGENNGLFEPVHGSAPDIAGKNKANPIAMILSASLMLEFLEMTDEAQSLQNVVTQVIREARVKTPDMGGNATTNQMAKAILHKL